MAVPPDTAPTVHLEVTQVLSIRQKVLATLSVLSACLATLLVIYEIWWQTPDLEKS